jgi:hypothetical protein
VDIFFDPYIDTTGKENILRVAKKYPNTVFAFKFRKEQNESLAAIFKEIGRHTVPYSREEYALVQSWPDYNLHGMELPVKGLTETASLILLNACETGTGMAGDVFINIARELQRTTNAVVIAQQYLISDTSGIVFSEAFYKTFAKTLSPEYALIQARKFVASMRNTVASDWVSPVYFIK